MRRAAWGSAVIVAVAMALSACSSPDSGTESQAPETLSSLHAEAVKGGYKTEARALADGHVSRAELNQGVSDFGKCLVQNGLTFNLIGTNPVDGWRPVFEVFWHGLGNAKGESLAASCSKAHFDLINDGYELSNTDVMDPSLMANVLSCLNAEHVKVSQSARNIEDLLPLGSKDPHADAVIACIHKEGDHLPTGVMIAY